MTTELLFKDRSERQPKMSLQARIQTHLSIETGQIGMASVQVMDRIDRLEG